MNSIRVSIVAIPDAAFSTLSGIYDVLNAFTMLSYPKHLLFRSRLWHRREK